MCSPLHFGLLSLLFSVAVGLRRNAKRVNVNVDSIACPVMASLVTRGIMKPDAVGRVDINETIKGLMATGNSVEGSAFQSLGIVGFEYDDTHQVRRFTGPLRTPSNKYLNLFTMNTVHKCDGRSSKTYNGRPCNANPQFQQHGYSTWSRDPEYSKDAEKRFRDTFLRRGVLESIAGVGEKVMTIASMGKILSHARTRNGEYTGEFSLSRYGTRTSSPIAKYHPSVSARDQYTPVSQWQALLAWGGFWAAFAREKNGIAYITESDLRSFFIRGDFPKDWQMKPWGFRTNFEAVVQMKGMGCGDEMISVVEDILREAGPDPSEAVLSQLFIGTVRGFGTFLDDNYNRFEGH
jgi:hypothetical protein